MKSTDGLNPAQLDGIHKAVETIKYIDEICKNDGGHYNNEYSGRMMRYRGGYSYGDVGKGGTNWNGNYSGCYPEPYYYDPGYRMSNGRYSSYNNRYSRDGATTHMIDKLNRMLDQTNNETEKEAILDCIQRLSE